MKWQVLFPGSKKLQNGAETKNKEQGREKIENEWKTMK